MSAATVAAREAALPARAGRAGLVHAALRRDILALALRPGAALDETHLARRFGVSRSPVREALSRLAAEGLVVMLPNRTTQVAPLDLADFPRYAEALTLLQRVCTRLAAERRSEAELAEMRRSAHAFDASLVPYDHLEMSAANKAFHMSVARAARNRHFAAAYEALLDEGRRMLHLNFDHLAEATDRNPLAADHHLMVEAIAARDADRAEALAAAHAEGFRARMLDFLAASGTDAIRLAGGAATADPAAATQDGPPAPAPNRQERS